MSSANSCASSSAFSSRPGSSTHLPVSAAPWPRVEQQHSSLAVRHDFYGCSEPSTAHSTLQSLRVSQQQHRSSWANLLAQDVVDTRAKSATAFLGQPSEAPPPYDQLQQQVNWAHLAAGRQLSNASAGTQSTTAGVPFSISKGSSNFQFGGGPSSHFPLGQARPPSNVVASRTGSGLSSTQTAVGPAVRSVSSGTGSSSRPPHRQQKRDRMQELRQLWARPGCRLCCLALILLLIGLLIGVALLTSHLTLPQHLEFAWFAPDQFRTGSGQTPQQSGSNRGRLDVGQLGQQIRLELSGAPPFRSNFISVLDFKTNQVAILDLSLRSGQRNLVCFVTPLDRQNIRDMDSLLRAAKAGANRRNQLYGWEESWQWMPSPLSQSPVFQPEVAECQGARWVQLSRVGSDQKGQKCTECFDFCLPDWGVHRDVIRDEDYLNVLRRICFSLFVPEWRPFAQGQSGQQNQLDFEHFYRGQQPQTGTGLLAGSGQQQQQAGAGSATAAESKWISLQTPPQQPHAAGGTNLLGQSWPSNQFAGQSTSGQQQLAPAASAASNIVKPSPAEQPQQQLLLFPPSSWQQTPTWPSASGAKTQPNQGGQQQLAQNFPQAGNAAWPSGNNGQPNNSQQWPQQQPSVAGIAHQQQPFPPQSRPFA